MRFFYRFSAPAPADRDWLLWLQVSVESRCGIQPDSFDWYVRRDPEPNAFAVGRRSIAVTTGFLQLLYAGRLTHAQAVAVGVHEAGHHVTRGTRFGLAVDWLSWPWRAGHGLVMRFYALTPFGEAAKMLMPVVFGVAAVMLVREEGPPAQVVPVLVLMGVVAVGVFIAPVADAAFSRAGERAADAYATAHGAGPDLAAALYLVAPCRPHGPLAGLRNTHPATDARMRRLTTTAPVAAGS